MSKEDDHSWSVDERESTSDGGTRQSADAMEQEKAEEEAVAKITERETRQVQVWRIFTLLILIAVSVVVSTITYRLLEAQDVDEFEDSVSIASLKRAMVYYLIIISDSLLTTTLPYRPAVCILRSSHRECR
jgi:muconolactone delta-isomerase